MVVQITVFITELVFSMRSGYGFFSCLSLKLDGLLHPPLVSAGTYDISLELLW